MEPTGSPAAGTRVAAPAGAFPSPVSACVRADAQRAFLAGIGELVPQLVPAAGDLLARVSTPNWALEWGLAEWLGRAYGLPEATRRRLLLSNVYLIALARVTDDLADGEARHPESDTVLATTLHHLWLRQYRRIFDEAGTAHAFWPYLDAGLGAWMRATLAPAPALSDRGAFLRVAAAASCVRAGREDAVAGVTAALDALLVGVVMLDDFFDWPGDLSASRANSFIAHCVRAGAGARPAAPPAAGAGWPAGPARDLAACRRGLARAVYLDGAGGSFFRELRLRLAAAGSASRAAGCAGLTAYIAWYDAEVAACEAWHGEHVRARVAAFVDGTRDGYGGDRTPGAAARPAPPLAATP
jgi:hypothetical protein